jgi:hypothetical protein
MIEKYEHHGVEVSVESKNKGQHRQNCLCFYPCAKFKPDTAENCPIAKDVFAICVRHHITTPVFECPEFEDGTA